MVEDLIQAIRQAVREAMRNLAISDAARKLVRVEISYDMEGEIHRAAHAVGGFRWPYIERGKGYAFEGVSLYPVRDLPVHWRIIGPGITTSGRLDVVEREGPKVEEKVG